MGDSLISTIKKASRGGLFHIFFGNVFTKAIGFLSSIVVINYISKEEYASLAYAVNIYSYISLLSGFGIAYALLKYSSSEENDEKNFAYLGFSLKFDSLINCILVITVLILIRFSKLPFAKSKIYFLLLAFLQIMSGSLTVLQIYIRTELKNKLYAMVGVTVASVILICGIVLVRIYDGYGYVLAQYIGVLSGIIICGRSIKASANSWRNKGSIKVRLLPSDYRTMIGLGISMMMTDFFSGIIPINEAFLVNNLLKNEIITANFNVAGLLPAQLQLISGSLVVYYFPQIARMRINKFIWKKCVNIGLTSFILVLIVSLIGMIATPYLIKLLYGSKYLDAINISYLLWIMRAVNAGLRMVPMNMLNALGKSKFNAWCSATTCLVITAIDILLIKKIGINGVAYGAMFVYFLSSIVLWYYLYDTCNRGESNVLETE